MAVAAIVDELSFSPPGPDRARAIDTAIRFLEAGISALWGPASGSGPGGPARYWGHGL
ncbi:MAG TPA: hypothetical protein VMH35_28265 [Streptosporangiaceae bacterium]|nr:hypothetical protein [Streptosporangiaceae bacterium]